MEAATLYDLLAGLLEYPREDYFERVALCLEAFQGSEATHALLDEFARRIAGLSTEELQELYVQSFDLNPGGSLDVGWHLFGENYERGAFLVKMREQLRRFSLPESSELPDHLGHVLAALGRMEPEEGAEFAAGCVFPALDKMRAGLGRKENPFAIVLESVVRLLESQHPRPAESLVGTPALRVLNDGGLE